MYQSRYPMPFHFHELTKPKCYPPKVEWGGRPNRRLFTDPHKAQKDELVHIPVLEILKLEQRLTQSWHKALGHAEERLAEEEAENNAGLQRKHKRRA